LLAEQGLEPRQDLVEPVPNDANHAADAAVYQARDTGRRSRFGLARTPKTLVML
jgi:hypothetical protein